MGLLNKRFWCNISTNVLLFVIVLVVILLYEFGILPTYKSGFYSGDQAISMPYFENDTVPPALLGVVVIVVPFLFIALVEYINHRNPSAPTETKKAMNLTFYWFREYMVGLGFNILLVEIMKITIGKPRPCFCEVCRPEPNCSLNGLYIQSFTCTNTQMDAHTILDANRSFPSGHASLAVQSALFLFLYIKERCRAPWMAVLFMQLVCLTWGSFTPLSRIIDYRHHWWDVLAGTLIGIVFTIYTVYKLCNNFSVEGKSSSKNFTLVIDKMLNKKLNHVDNNNISRDAEIHAI